jgi:hypothetical protein
MWGRVRTALLELDPVRVENRLEKGTPDVNLMGGEWVELKWKRKKPLNSDKILRLDHEYMLEQRNWAERRIYCGGKVFVLVKISSEWILLWGTTAAKYLERVSLNELRQRAIRTWPNKLNDQELRNCILHFDLQKEKS